MRKNYNYKRRKLLLPEYGRHVQEMIDSLLEIEDRRERTRQAKAVIAVMGDINPVLRDSADFTHKLWDHMIIMSDFKLDVDSPYPLPSRQELTVKPQRMEYPQSYVSHKHYGKYVGRMLRRLAHAPQSEYAQPAGDIARFMRMKSAEYNQEFPNNEVIVNDVRSLSGNVIELDEVALNNLRNDHKQHFSQRPQNGFAARRSNQPQGQRNNRGRQQQNGRWQQKNQPKHSGR